MVAVEAFGSGEPAAVYARMLPWIITAPLFVAADGDAGVAGALCGTPARRDDPA